MLKTKDGLDLFTQSWKAPDPKAILILTHRRGHLGDHRLSENSLCLCSQHCDRALIDSNRQRRKQHAEAERRGKRKQRETIQH